MPRGRPPLARTKEEAQAARREQIRKNVQAFRDRKKGVEQAGRCQSDVKEDGYTFLIEEPAQSNQKDEGQEPSTECIASLTSRAVPDHCDDLSRLQNDGPQKLQDEPQVLRQAHALSDFDKVTISIDNGPAALQQLTSSVIFTFSPKNPVVGPHWCQVMPSFVNRDYTLDLSIQALCLLQISLLSSNINARAESLSLYHSALRSLRLALNRSPKRFSIEIFTAIQILGGYELFHGTQKGKKSWKLHIEGAGSYLNTFTSLDQSVLSHPMFFHWLDSICIFDALGSRRPSRLSSSNWWRRSVDKYGGEVYGSLLRMLTTLPGILQQCDHAVSLNNAPESTEEQLRLLRVCLKMEDAFLDWFDRTLDAEEGTVCEKDALQSMHDRRKDSRQGNAFQFSSIFTARLYLLYWSSMVLLYESITDLLNTLHPEAVSSGQIPIAVTGSSNAIVSPQAYVASAESFASSILLFAPFCLDLKFGIIGRSLALLPLFVARNYWRRIGDEAQAALCDERLEALGQKEMEFGLRV